nr:hypothetical protein [uncultured bacterium]
MLQVTELETIPSGMNPDGAPDNGLTYVVIWSATSVFRVLGFGRRMAALPKHKSRRFIPIRKLSCGMC